MSRTWAMGPRVCSSRVSVPYARLERTPMRSSNPRHGRLCAPEQCNNVAENRDCDEPHSEGLNGGRLGAKNQS